MLNSPLSARPVIEALEARIAPATFTVTTTADSGPGSLRQAILDANALEGADTIGFAIDGDQLQIIALTSPLPAISDQLTITGAGERVRIDGTEAGDNAIGLRLLNATNSTVSQLEIANFGGTGLLVDGGSGNKIEKNTLFGNGGPGLHIRSSANAFIHANLIGETSTVSGSSGNAMDGLRIENSTAASIQYNSISGNDQFGIEVIGGAGHKFHQNVVDNNGSVIPSGAQGGGIAIVNSANNWIGLVEEIYLGSFQADSPRGNKITQNTGVGILISGSASSGNLLSWNQISGTIGGDGLKVADGASGTRVGALYKEYTFTNWPGPMYVESGTRAATNEFRDNDGWGVHLAGAGTDTSIDGTTVSSNFLGGVLIQQSGSTFIGGQGGRINQFVNNQGAGIAVVSSTGTRIWSGSFSGNGGLPIDLGNDGPTPNDPGDTDTGANALQNAPELQVAYSHLPDPNPYLLGHLVTDSPNTSFQIQLYTRQIGTSQWYPSSTLTIQTGSDGTANFETVATEGVEFVATATNLPSGNTSEFSTLPSLTPKVTLSGGSAVEGDSGTQELVFTIKLHTATTVPVTVRYRTTDDTAIAGQDYAGLEGSVVFAPGETSKTVSVMISGDQTQEATERFNLELLEATNGTIYQPSASGTIINDDALPAISISGTITSEGFAPGTSNPNLSEVLYTVSLSQPSLDPVTVRVIVAGGTATDGTDYSGGSAVLTFTPGTTTLTGSLLVVDDAIREGNETVLLQLIDPTAGTLGNADAVITIVDNDSWILAPENITVLEGNSGQTSALLTVRLTSIGDGSRREQPITVTYATQGRTAISGSDFLPTQGVLTFGPNDSSLTIEIPIVGDTFSEVPEQFSINFSQPSGATLSTKSATVTIQTDDPPEIVLSGGSIVEGDSGQKLLSFTATLSNLNQLPVTARFSTADGTATAGSDYEAVSQEITFAPGETIKTISVPIFGDNDHEGSETFLAILSDITGAAYSNNPATGRIINDEITISISDSSVTEGVYRYDDFRSPKYVTFQVTLSEASEVPVIVNYATADQSASNGSDYLASSGSIVFQPGTTSSYISVRYYGDDTSEPSEVFTVNLSNPQNADLSKSIGYGTIDTDDSYVTIRPRANGNEEGGAASFSVILFEPSAVPISVTFNTVAIGPGSATPGVDYVETTGTVTFAPGETSKQIDVPVLDDSLFEGVELVYVRLTGASGVVISDVRDASVAIFDPEDSFSVSGGSIIEGHSGTKMLVFTVTPAATFGYLSEVDVTYSIQDGTALAGSDFIPVEGTLAVTLGKQQIISVPIIGDTEAEPDESFVLKFHFSNFTVPDTLTTGTILNDDTPDLLFPTLTVSGSSIQEGHSGSTSLNFTLNLSKASSSPVSVHFGTTDGTASAGSDYTATSGTITFAPGETTKTISVPILGDKVQEADETLRLLLSNVIGANLTTAEVLGTIANDDSSVTLPVLSVASASVIEGHSGTSSLVFTFSLSKASSAPVSVQYGTADGTALAGSDYTAASGTLTFAPGETTKTVSVPVLGDTVQEADETLRLLLSNGSGASLATAEVQGTIANDDSPEALPVLSLANASVVEGSDGNQGPGGLPAGPFLSFTFTLSKASSSPVSVHFATADGTATAGSDYTAGSGTLTFAPGETTKSILLPILGDSVQEANETLRLLLSEVSGATLAQNEATGTILNDDLSPDATDLVISKGGRKATWTDSDGDLVTLTATKPILALSSFHFVSSAEGDGLVLQQLNAAGQAGGAKGALGLSFSIKKSASGDGLVHVGAIDATGRDLTSISLPGRLGAVFAGDTNLKTPAIHKLTVDAFGLDAAAAQAGDGPLLSNVKGSIGSLVVKHDFTGANLVVSGGSVGSLVIGGSLEGSSTATPASISIEKSLSTLRIGGDVIHANVIAGAGTQAGAHVDQVQVGGSWTASNLVVGAGAGPDGLYGTGDDTALQDTVSRIARISIRGAVSGTAEAESGSDHFGFVAGRIAAFQVGAQKLSLSSKWKDSMEIGSTSDVMLRELAGRSRA